MPRLSKNQYLIRHRFLQDVWRLFPKLFSVLPVDQQWLVHRYYQVQLHAEVEVLLENRQSLTRDEPSLPHRASKGFALLYRSFCAAYDYAKGDDAQMDVAIDSLIYHLQRKRDHRLPTTMAYGMAAPEPDIDALANAFMRLAEQLQDEENDQVA